MNSSSLSNFLFIGAGLFGAFATASAEKFTIAVLPDTQHYSENFDNSVGQIFGAQTQWIVDNAVAENIKMVVHLGDVVEHGPNQDEWILADMAMDKLDAAGIPYGVCLGNHDNHYDQNGEYSDPVQYPDGFDNDAEDFVQFFGMEDRIPNPKPAWYGGSSPTQRSNYQTITVDGRHFLFLNMMIDVPDEELAWADQVIASHPDHLVIFSTHRYIYDFRITQGRYGDGTFGRPGDFTENGLADEQYAYNANFPEPLFQDFIRSHPQIIMVMCGHSHGQYNQVSTNDAGLPVIEMLADYQESPNGGNGFLRLVEIDTDTGEISFRTYSPTLDRGRTLADEMLEAMSLAASPANQQALGAALGLTQPEIDGLVAQVQGDIPNIDLAAILPQVPEDVFINYFGVPAANLVGAGQLSSTTPSLAELVAFFNVAENADGDDIPDTASWEGLYAQAFAAGNRDSEFEETLDLDAPLVAAAAIPEPAFAGLLAGLAAFLYLRRHRR
ncbi:MAG: metallophosphoesterase [Opitutales bacterium]